MAARGTRPINRTSRILLVTTRWASVDIPSLALGVLRRAVREQHSDAAVEILYGNLEYVDWITEHCSFEAADYSHFSLDTYFDGFCEWVFFDWTLLCLCDQLELAAPL